MKKIERKSKIQENGSKNTQPQKNTRALKRISYQTKHEKSSADAPQVISTASKNLPPKSRDILKTMEIKRAHAQTRKTKRGCQTNKISIVTNIKNGTRKTT